MCIFTFNRICDHIHNRPTLQREYERKRMETFELAYNRSIEMAIQNGNMIAIFVMMLLLDATIFFLVASFVYKYFNQSINWITS